MGCLELGGVVNEVYLPYRSGATLRNWVYSVDMNSMCPTSHNGVRCLWELYDIKTLGDGRHLSH